MLTEFSNLILISMKSLIFKILNKISLIFLLVRIFILSIFRSNSHEEEVTLAVFADYLDVSFLLSSTKLESKKIVFFCTRRYPFFQLLRTKSYRKIFKIVVVKDYSSQQYQFLMSVCKLYNVQVSLIQAGDFLVPAYNYINRAISLKGNSELAVQCSLDKAVMREMLNKLNISPFKVVDLLEREDIKKVDFYPSVLKPKIGTFSEGVVLLKSESDFYDLIDTSEKQRRVIEFKTGYLVEEYIDGRQFDVEGIIHNGKLIILSIIEENYTGFFPYFNINWFFFNAFIGNNLYDKIYELLQNIFESCGMCHGAYHCELRIDRDGNIRILEFSNRMGGGFEEPISKVTGNNFVDLYIESMLDMLGDEILINKNEYLLQKYFQHKDELYSWKSYLKDENIQYIFKELNYRGHIGMISIYHSDKSIMLKIADKFDLAFQYTI